MKVGILGGGQLGRMLSEASAKLNIETAVYDPAEDCCAGKSFKHFCHSYADSDKLKEFAEWADIITYEFENVPLDAINFLTDFKKVHPPVSAIEATQDRLSEKKLLNSLGIETAPFVEINSREDLHTAAEKLGFPFIIKTRHGGYDGKGQWFISDQKEMEESAPEFLGKKVLAEGMVKFDREVSMIAVRNLNGDFKFFDICENRHKNGILHHTTNETGDPIQAQAEDKARKLLNHLDYCGVLTIEYFQCGDHLIANEYAPRVHNSGHWTIEGTHCSQFESHIRAVCGLPLGDTSSKGDFLMYNFIGSIPSEARNPDFEGAALHDYNKEDRPGRKVGHMTLKLNSPDVLTKRLEFFNTIES